MKKLVFIDLDHTLAELFDGITEKTRSLMNLLEEQVQFVMISGKPTIYLQGLARQANFKNVIISGENGQDIVFDGKFPSFEHVVLPITNVQKKELELIKSQILDLPYEYYFQPNIHGLSVFFKTKDEEKALHSVVNLMNKIVTEIDIDVYYDVIDFKPTHITKGNALTFISNHLNIPLENTIAIGDGENDISMFEKANTSIKIGNRIDYKTTHQFDQVDEALIYILNHIHKM